MSRSMNAVSPSELSLTPRLIEQLAIEAHLARADILARQLKQLAAAKARLDAEVPDVVRQMGEERAYLFAQAVVNGVLAVAGFAARLWRRLRALLSREAGHPTPELAQPLASIRTIAETLRANPALSPEERERMLGIIVEETEYFDRMVSASVNPSRDSDRLSA